MIHNTSSVHTMPPKQTETETAGTGGGEPPAPSLPFPRGTAFVSVEYPGYVGDLERVLDTLGGRERIGRVGDYPSN